MTKQREPGGRRRTVRAAAVLAVAMLAAPLSPAPRAEAAGSTLAVLEVRADPPTPYTLGVQVLISGDDDYDATISVRYRVYGTSSWTAGLPLFRVRPETVHRQGGDPPPQFAGSVFGLRPATEYEFDLYVADPDNAAGQHVPHRATTSALPASPTTTIEVDPTSFAEALRTVGPGTVLRLKAGDYHGPFVLRRSGQPGAPIVLRGANRDGVRLIGGDMDRSVLDVQGDFVHIQNLTLTDGLRGIRFPGTTDANAVVTPRRGAVVTGTRITATTHGIVAGYRRPTVVSTDRTDSFICNNVLEGPLDPGDHYDPDDLRGYASYVGVVVGSGSVACNNTISGYGDAVVVSGQNSRGIDIFGNDVLWSYDNGVETDFSEGNVRVSGNRLLNTHSPLSFQPVSGGPVYVTRNVVVNAFSEVLKFHGDAATPTADNANGVLVYNNTFVRAGTPLLVETPVESANFSIVNNLFIGGDGAVDAMLWYAPYRLGRFNYNGYYPNGGFRLGAGRYTDIVDLRNRGGQETRGLIVPRDALATLRPWPGWDTLASPSVDANLAAGSPARDLAVTLANVNNVPDGRPDIGALEYGCPVPVYGVRSSASTEPFRCTG